MDSTSIMPFAALLVGAVVIVVILLRLMRASQRKAELLPPPSSDEEYLDSSHIGGPIVPGSDPRQSDAAARAAAALRNARQNTGS